jgi:hypothetical protein
MLRFCWRNLVAFYTTTTECLYNSSTMPGGRTWVVQPAVPRQLLGYAHWCARLDVPEMERNDGQVRVSRPTASGIHYHEKIAPT